MPTGLWLVLAMRRWHLTFSTSSKTGAKWNPKEKPYLEGAVTDTSRDGND